MFKTVDIMLHIPFSMYETFWISKKWGFSEATACTFLRERFTILLEFLFLVGPLAVLVTVVVQITGKYVILGVIVLTPIVKFIVLYLYPKLIMPLYSNFKVFPAETSEQKNLLGRIRALAKRVDYELDQIVVEESRDGDLHSNASCTFNRIELSETMLTHH